MEKNIRLTVLTPTLLRLEFDPEGRFEDRPSLFAVQRNPPPPPLQVARKDGTLTLSTSRLELRYQLDSGFFCADNLGIRLQLGPGQFTDWRPGASNPGNLGGTLRTLDGARGPVRLDDGLLSRDGWYLIDDTRTPVFTPDWIEARSGEGRRDWYFFGYGRDYRQALRDLVTVSGRIPLPPSFVFGSWYSRYWSYTQEDFVRIVEEHREHGFPLDVLVMDMDWHLPGWTGYTWNRELIPDPDALLRLLHQRGIAVCLNLHPASGVHPHEEAYDAFARAVGVDPGSRRPIPFDCTDPGFMRAYFEILHHPLERRGVDFWWLDWQQQTTSAIHHLDPLMWLNHLHFHHLLPISTRRKTPDPQSRAPEGAEPNARTMPQDPPPYERGGGEWRERNPQRDAEPSPKPDRATGADRLIFSRWGGWGSHRYPVQFSGDAESRWEVLAFEVELTATSGNAGCAYWSHDIGGHWSLEGRCNHELFTRWVQFGALSPVLRVHSTRDPANDRRAWLDGEPFLSAMRKAHRLRSALRPYLERCAVQCREEGVAPCRPMYLDAPETDDAYAARGQYYLGDDLIAVPVVTPGIGPRRFARVEAWLPPGAWTEWESGRKHIGPVWVAYEVALGGILIFEREKAGVLPGDLRAARNVRLVAAAENRRSLPQPAARPLSASAGPTGLNDLRFVDDWRFIGPFEPHRDRPEVRAALELMMNDWPLPAVWRGPDDLRYDVRRYRTVAATVPDRAYRLDHAVNLKAVFGEEESIGIAAAELHTDLATPSYGVLLLRHDDPLTLWLNGRQVYDADLRPVYDPPVRLDLELNARANRIVVLQKQFGRRWGFDLSLVTPGIRPKAPPRPDP